MLQDMEYFSMIKLLALWMTGEQWMSLNFCKAFHTVPCSIHVQVRTLCSEWVDIQMSGKVDDQAWRVCNTLYKCW